MSKKSYVLVVNLKSRQASEAVEKIQQIFKSKSIDLKILAAKNPKKLSDLFRKAIDLNPEVIVIGGGDGTLTSGIEYLSKKNYTKEIGILPLGTANYLARDLSIPLSLRDSIETLLRGKSQKIPLGVSNEKYFSLTFIVGLTQAVAENVSDKHKKKLGQVAYLIELYRQSKIHESFTYHIETPGFKKPLTGLTHQITVYNSDINHQIKLAPDHKLHKPTLKVVISRCGRSKFKFYYSFLLHIITFGKIRTYMHVFEAQELLIKTKPVVRGDYDGEPHGNSPFSVKIAKQRAKIIC